MSISESLTAAQGVVAEADSAIKISCRNINVSYNGIEAVSNVSIDLENQAVTAFIGSSGSGKSSFLRCLNRMNDTIAGTEVRGEIIIDGQDINAPEIDPDLLRSRVGMVFQHPNPFPKSIYDNVAYGPRIHRLTSSRAELDKIVETSLRDVGLWDEVKDRLKDAGTGLSSGQQQRLCLARTLAINPEIILMDEPCSALDPIATSRVEKLIDDLKERYCIVIVTHSMQQAARVSQKTAFFNGGKLIEFGDTEDIFTNPTNQQTLDYITGRFS